MIAVFLSHLGGDEGEIAELARRADFLSHLGGDEALFSSSSLACWFLSHLGGDEVCNSTYKYFLNVSKSPGR